MELNNLLNIEPFDSSGNKTAENAQETTFMYRILQNSGLSILAVFLVIYLVAFLIFGNAGLLFDIAALVTLVVFVVYKYTTADTKIKTNIVRGLTQKGVDFAGDPLSLFTTIVFIVCFYLIVFALRIPTNELAPFTVMIMGVFGWALIVFLVIHNALKTLFKVDLLVILRDPSWLTPVTGAAAADTSGNVVTNTTPEVFNIANNSYTYDDSQAICRAYDSRLATYDEIESAYNNGAEWCNYGWSANQMAFFPTQKKTWQDLQNSEKHKNNCGRPGVNGGYFANPNIKFGVNCFGMKPAAKKNDVSWKDVSFPKTEEDKKLEEKIKYWQDNLDENLQVSSFNKIQWSRY
jgi:hypothetical protein